MINLQGNPFFLDASQQSWVHETLATLSTDEKIGQLFCETMWHCKDEEEDHIFSEIAPGGVLFRPNTAEKVQRYVTQLQARSKVPMLIAANFEQGGSGGLSDGTYYGTQMQVAATDDPICAERLGFISGREGRAAGFNWSFAPLCDISYNCFSTVTNTRTSGSDPERVIGVAKGYIKGAQQAGMASTIKHFPGDGIDFRDQHKVASINTLSVDEWEQTYGKVYRELIEAGAESVMTAHIKLPAYSKLMDPTLRDQDVLPASLSYDMNVTLLREKLGFNGLIVSDDTHMAGFMVAMPREKAVPACIAAGTDMFLFTVNHKEDVEWMRSGVRDGVISSERLDEAVTRILALKAKLHLHISFLPRESAADVIGCEEHKQWSFDCADKAVTLVKDVKSLLPITPQKYPRILLHSIDRNKAGRYDNHPQYEKFRDALRAEGFIVTEMDLDKMPGIGVLHASIKELQQSYDLMIYFAGARAGYRAEWQSIVCGDIPSYVHEIPTLAISFGNPFFLMDMPMVSTYINAYSESNYTRCAVLEKLTGKSQFTGVSPVDPFCGMWDLAL